MHRWASICLTSVIACALVGSGYGQDRTRNPSPAPALSSGTPAGGPVTAHIYPQLMHIRFTKAVTAPASPQVLDVRAHLENPLLANVTGSAKKAVILPSDIDVNLDIRIDSADPQNANARMHLRIMSANVDPAEGRRRFQSAEVIHDFVGWPKPGDVLIPAGTTFSIPFFGSDGPARADALAATDPNADRAEDNYPSRPILAGANLPIALVDQPIDVNNAGSNKLFRAQLTQDMQYPQSGTAPPTGVINLKSGTEVYVRSYEPDPSAPLGHIAVWSVDFVVVNGKKIPVKGLGLRTPFAPGSMAISPDGKAKIPMILWPLGQTRQFQIQEQQEISSNGTPLWTYPTTTDVFTASATPAANPTTPTSASSGRPTSPANRPGIPPDLQRQMDDARKRSEDMRACQQQAMKDHAGDPRGMADAFAACQAAARPRP